MSQEAMHLLEREEAAGGDDDAAATTPAASDDDEAEADDEEAALVRRARSSAEKKRRRTAVAVIETTPVSLWKTGGEIICLHWPVREEVCFCGLWRHKRIGSMIVVAEWLSADARGGASFECSRLCLPRRASRRSPPGSGSSARVEEPRRGNASERIHT